MTRIWFHVVAFLALWGGEVIAEDFVNFTIRVEGANTTITGYPKSATGSVVIPAAIDGKPVIGIEAGAFSERIGLTNVTIPNSVTSIGNGAFARCTGLTSVEIGNSVTSIGEGAFAQCTGLTSVKMRKSVTSIGGGAFAGCTGLASVYFEGNAPLAGADTFSDIDSKNLKLYIYKGTTGFRLPPWDIYLKILIGQPNTAPKTAPVVQPKEERKAGFNPAALPRATKAFPYINTLKMEFVPVAATPGVFWSRWETRVRDYAAFCLETKRDHKKPDFEQGDDHPVVDVSFNDAQAFCVWLSKKEGRAYRLPTDHEWSCAVGIGAQEDAAASPKAKDEAIKGVYPWGTAWPPPEGSGNFNSSLKVDSYDNTSPVGKFSPTADGLYDLSGNVWEWCDSLYKPDDTHRVSRGGSWYFNAPTLLLSSCRNLYHPSFRVGLRGFRVVLGVGGGG